MGNKMVAVAYADMTGINHRKPRRYAELRQRIMSTRRYARVLYDFPNPEQGEIALKVNDIVEITGQVNPDWLSGKIGHKSGNFPTTFIRYIELPDVDAQEKVFGAIETFDSKVDGDLHFKKGDVIIGVKAIDDNWWHGQLDNRVGIFPVTLVKSLETSSKPAEPGQPKLAGEQQSLTGQNGRNKTVNNNSNDCVVVVARANTDMKAQISDELSFEKGDVITILRAEDEDFYHGECRGKSGTFPIYFVDILEPEKFEMIKYKGDQKRSLTSFKKTASYKISPSEINTEVSSPLNIPNATPSYEQPVTPASSEPTSVSFQTERLTSHDETIDAYGRSLYPFVGQNSDELTFLDNEIIRLVRHVDDQWTMGQIDDRCGIFPTSFVEIIVDCPSGTTADDGSLMLDDESHVQEVRNANDDVGDERLGTGDELRKTAIAIADFMTEDDGCLTLLEGETVTVTEIVDEHWCLATNVSGQSGYVPTGYVQFLDTELDLDGDRGESSTDDFSSEKDRCFDGDSNEAYYDAREDVNSTSADYQEQHTTVVGDSSYSDGTDGVIGNDKTAESNHQFKPKPKISPKPLLRPKPPGKTFVTSSQSSMKGLSLDDVIGRELYHAKRSSDPEAAAATAAPTGPSLDQLKNRQEKENVEKMWTSSAQYTDNSVGRNISHTTGMSDLETNTKLRTELIRDEAEQPTDPALWAPPSYDAVVPRRVAPPRPAAPSQPVTEVVHKPRRPAPKPPVRKSLNREENGASSITDIGDGEERDLVIHDLKNRIKEIETDLKKCKMSKHTLEVQLSNSESEEERTDLRENLSFYSANVDGLSTELQSLNKSLHQLEPTAQPSRATPPLSSSPQPDPALELANRRQKHREKREKILQELVETERNYLRDLELVWEAFLCETAPKCPAVDMDTLFGNIDEVTQLSRDLVSRLEAATSGIDFEEQCVGQSFVDMKERMTKVYSLYCRNHDDVLALLEKYEGNEEIDEYFNQGVHYIKQHTVLFDLGSLLIKPVQRVLKYPLLLNELMKCTEDSHPDKAMVIKGINVMTDVAQAINEYKRRKDLVYKYRKDHDASLSNKIAKMNLHSLRKKSSRVSTRLSTSLGLGSSTRDVVFDQIETRFRNVEKVVKLFLRDLDNYAEQLKRCAYELENCGVDIREFYMEKTPLTDQVDRYQKGLSVIGVQHLDRFREVLNMKVVEPLNTLVNLFQGPNNVIKKRYDKLLDYDHLTSSIKKIKDPEQLLLANQNLELAKKTYEALNAQLLDELPRLNNLSIALFDDCVRNFVHAQKIFHEKAKREFADIVKQPMFQKVTEANVIEQFGIQHSRLVDRLADLSFAPKNFNPAREVKPEKEVKPERNKSLRRSSRKNSGDKGGGEQKDPRRLSGIQANYELGLNDQNDSQIQFLRAKYKPEKLHRATSSYQAKLSHELSIPCNHVVAVIKEGDPMGGKDLWFVDNAVVQGFVPSHILTPFLPTTSEVSRRHNANPASRPLSESRASWYDDIQGLDVSSSGQEGQVNARDSTDSSAVFSDRPRSSYELGAAVPDPTPTNHDLHAQYQDGPSALMQHKAQYQNLALEHSTRTSALTPVVTESSPDKLDSGRHYANRQDSNDLLNEALDELLIDEGDVPPSYIEVTSTSQPEYFRALYDFNARNGNEMDIRSGETLLIVQKHDRDGNAEWWLAERSGTKGFVPANYLADLS